MYNWIAGGLLEGRLDEVLAGVDGGSFTAAEAIEWPLAAQIEQRNSRRLATAMRSIRLPGRKSLANVFFSFQSAIRRVGNVQMCAIVNAH